MNLTNYSFLDPVVSSDPYAFYQLLHEQQPVYRMPETGAYVITKYEHVRQALKDTESFSSDVRAGNLLRGGSILQGILRERGWEHVQTLQRTDPPVHRRYRKLLDRVFTGKRVREMAPYIESVARDLIDGWIDAGTCDFNAEFAMPMPGIIVAEQLGLGREGIVTFKRWADAMLGAGLGPNPTEDAVRAQAEIELEAQHYLAAVFEERRRQPTDDLISALVHAHGEDEEPLSVHELQNIMHQLITGGFETTQSAINHGMWNLVRFPELVPKLRDDPARIRGWVEEVLRWESPVQFLARRATRDVELGGTIIPEGALVLIGYGPANRDAEKFECPHRFDLERENAGAHLAFGSGAHFCVGALLARQEMIASFTQIVDRLDNIRLAKPLPDPVHAYSLFFMPMQEFHIAFDKRNA
jgi:cytochrome P450